MSMHLQYHSTDSRRNGEYLSRKFLRRMVYSWILLQYLYVADAWMTLKPFSSVRLITNVCQTMTADHQENDGANSNLRKSMSDCEYHQPPPIIHKSNSRGPLSSNSRRSFLSSAAGRTSAIIMASGITSTALTSLANQHLHQTVANAIGPVKISLQNPIYVAKPCPPDKPIPGEKAMKGMRGLCVSVRAKLNEAPPEPLIRVGVYGFVTDELSGESVLANNPDFGTDAGQFAMIESVTPKDDHVDFEFIAAVPMDKDISKYENGIGPLSFESLRIISFPGGQQFGAISPCEMNEFSDECEVWEAENGPYQRGEFMVRPNERTKGR